MSMSFSEDCQPYWLTQLAELDGPLTAPSALDLSAAGAAPELPQPFGSALPEQRLSVGPMDEILSGYATHEPVLSGDVAGHSDGLLFQALPPTNTGLQGVTPSLPQPPTRRATVSFALPYLSRSRSRTPNFDSRYGELGLYHPDAIIDTPQTLDAAHELLAAWGAAQDFGQIMPSPAAAGQASNWQAQSSAVPDFLNDISAVAENVQTTSYLPATLGGDNVTQFATRRVVSHGPKLVSGSNDPESRSSPHKRLSPRDVSPHASGQSIQPSAPLFQPNLTPAPLFNPHSTSSQQFHGANPLSHANVSQSTRRDLSPHSPCLAVLEPSGPSLKPSSTPASLFNSHSTPSRQFGGYDPLSCAADGQSVYSSTTPGAPFFSFSPSLLVQSTATAPITYSPRGTPIFDSAQDLAQQFSQFTSPEWGQPLASPFSRTLHPGYEPSASLRSNNIPAADPIHIKLSPNQHPLVSPLSNSEPRRESDPFPVAPIPQRPWEQRHRYSIANIPSHLTQTNEFADFLGRGSFASTSESMPTPADSHRPLGSFSTNASHYASTGPPTATTSAFMDNHLETWPEMNYPVHEDHMLPFSNPSSAPDNVILDMMETQPQKFSPPAIPADHYSTQNAHQPTASADGNFNLEGGPFSCQLPALEEQPSGATESITTSEPSTHAFGGVMAPIDLEPQHSQAHFDFFQPGRTAPFSLSDNPHRSISPYTPSGNFNSAPQFLGYPNTHTSLELAMQEPTSDLHRLPELNTMGAQSQQQTRLRRLTIMTQPLWSEGSNVTEVGGSSFFRRPEGTGSTIGVKRLGGTNKSPREELADQSTRKRKVSRTKYQPVQQSLPEDAEPVIHEISSSERDSDESGADSQSLPDSSTSHQGTKDRGGLTQEEACLSSDDTYQPVRFGGIGQGKSPHPPGLNGRVKPSEEDFRGFVDESGERIVPWKQELRCDEDLYTPIWCRGLNDKKEGFCDMCEGGAWFRLKNSAYWYHKQYFHGVSSTTGHYFYPPREIKKGLSMAHRHQILGHCHECNEWVGFSSITGSQSSRKAAKAGREESEELKVSKVPTLWYKHAHKCHRHQTCRGAKGRKKSKKI